MIMSTSPLPSEFADLAPFTAWALPTETARNARRVASTQSELQAFASAMLPRVEDITLFIDASQTEPLPEPVERLFLMLLSLAEVAPAIEYYGQPTVVDGYESSRFKADETHALRPSR